MRIEPEEFFRYVEEHRQKYGCTPFFPKLAYKFGVTPMDISRFAREHDFRMFGDSDLDASRIAGATKRVGQALRPREEWWSYIVGHERFEDPASLYHAINDADARIEGISFEASRRTLVSLRCRGKLAVFDVDPVDFKEDGWDELLKSIIDSAAEKDWVMASGLSGAWFPERGKAA